MHRVSVTARTRGMSGCSNASRQDGRYAERVINSLTSSVGAIRKEHGAKLVRFGAVSAFNVVLGQALLFVFQTVSDWSAVLSNVIAVSIGAIPAYLLSRYWVWQKKGKNHLMREVVPFWSLAILGLLLSTASVWFVEQQWDPHPLVINLTNLTAFGVVWVAKFMILDRVLFADEGLSDSTHS